MSDAEASSVQTLARHKILSAPLVVSPGLEDVESLLPGESAPQLLGVYLLLCQLSTAHKHTRFMKHKNAATHMCVSSAWTTQQSSLLPQLI